MSEEEIIKAVHFKIVKCLLTNYSFKDGDRVGLEVGWDKTDLSVQNVIAAHLKFFISTIIQHMTYYKKKHLLYCHELNEKIDPRKSKTTNSYNMSSVIAYESTPFTAIDFFQLLKDHQNLIPKRTVYNACIQRLLTLDSVKITFPNDEKRKKKSVKRLHQK